MPLPNGVDPFGKIGELCPDAGLMGNRGILHETLHGPVVKDWQHKSWVACRLGFSNWQRGVRVDGKLRLMAQLDKYSELFFLDEATAFAAGHRPCGMCRKSDYTAFKNHWCLAHQISPDTFDPKKIDVVLHQERCAGKHGNKVSLPLSFEELPDGAMFVFGNAPCLKWKQKLWLWSDSGYAQREGTISAATLVDVLTPRSMLNVLEAGYPLQVHQTAAFA